LGNYTMRYICEGEEFWTGDVANGGETGLGKATRRKKLPYK